MKNRLTVKRSQGGFTLIELMMVVAIVAILLAVALPAYQNQQIRGHRSAAKAEMMEIANRQQQFLLSDRAYANDATLTASGYGLPTEVSDRYDFSVTVGAGTVPSFLITFTPKGSQASDGPLPLTLNSAGVKTPAEKWER
jgi:type IV pilus assembly protein PilE